MSRDLVVAVSRYRCFKHADITFKIVTSKITDTFLYIFISRESNRGSNILVLMYIKQITAISSKDNRRLKTKESEYDQEIPQSHTADQPMAS